MSDVDDLYDGSAFEERTPAPRPRGRGGVGAAVLAAALWAIDDIVMGEKQRTPIVEEVVVPGPDGTEPVVVHLVWDEPRLSWARVIDA